APRTVAATVAVYLIVGFGIIGVPALLALLGAANQLRDGGSDVGILAMLVACLATAFPPATGLAGLTAGLRARRHPTPPPGSWWMLVGGLWWCGLLLFLDLPGVANLLLEGGALLLLHPVAAIMGVMSADFARANALFANLWWVCTFCYTGAAVWLFYLSVLR